MGIGKYQNIEIFITFNLTTVCEPRIFNSMQLSNLCNYICREVN
jgi:hypothetical protein